MRMRAAIAGAERDPRQAGRISYDLDRLTASLHGRRSRMAELERLSGLCRIATLAEFMQTVLPGLEPHDVPGFQRRLVQRFTQELSGLLPHLSGSGARLLYWELIRFRVENLKVLIRTRFSESPSADAYEHIVPLPGELALDVQKLSRAESLDDFVQAAPKGLLRESLERSIEVFGVNSRPFFFEAVLDHDYLQVLLQKVEALPPGDREIVAPMFRQEADIFHLRLIVRGKFYYGLTPDALLSLHVPGARIHRTLFSEMLRDQDLRTSMSRAAGYVFDSGPFDVPSDDRSLTEAPDSTGLENLAWRRFARLANNAVRQSHMGLATVFGYVGIRRVEVANLVTLSEGIRKGMSPEAIGARMITYGGREATHV
jgi:vacuolar-type H+-ATPase subunit C/Vma6